MALNLEFAVEWLGDSGAAAVGGLLVGILFGFAAQRSRFCLRAAAVEFARGAVGERVAVWLLCFSAALAMTQSLIAAGVIDVSETRQLAQQGSLSGAAVGGLLFGCGMVLARGCASRLLVLSANGNLRALLSGLVFVVVAQAAYRGQLAPLREAISAWWLIEGGRSRDIMAVLGGGTPEKIAFALLWLAGAGWFAWRSRVGLTHALGAIGAGLAVVTGWLVTYSLAQSAFDPVPIKSLTFSGPSADVLMYVLSAPDKPLDFDLMIVPGVFLGSFLAAAWARELKLEGFEGGLSMRRYIIGAVLMGFGAMLAGGCAVGAGVSGASVFALTAWVVLVGIWGGAALTDIIIDRPRQRRSAAGAGPGALVRP